MARRSVMRLSKSGFAMVVAGATAAFALASWIYVDVQRELRTLAAANLRSLLDTQVGVLNTWIGEKQLNVERWAKDARILELAGSLHRLASGESNASALTAACRGAASDTLVGVIESLRQSDAAEGINLLDRSGRVLATRRREYCGLSVTPERLQQLRPVFEGKPVFAPPMSERERLGGAANGEVRALVWFSAPVFNQAGEVVAALNIGKFADARFSSALTAARPGSNGEAYAFDASGRMLSESRFRAELEQRGALKAGDSTILSVRLDGPAAERTTYPLTALVALALTGLAAPDSVLAGEVLQPYQNYVGIPVIGAWRWLPRHGFGIAVEAGSDEVFAPLRRIEIAYRVITTLAGAALLALLASA